MEDKLGIRYSSGVVVVVAGQRMDDNIYGMDWQRPNESTIINDSNYIINVMCCVMKE